MWSDFKTIDTICCQLSVKLHVINSLWSDLISAEIWLWTSTLLLYITFTGIKLREANQQQQFNRNVEDIELWLYEVEGHLASDDYGKDLTSVQNLQKKHALLEADVAAHQVPKLPLDLHCKGTDYLSCDWLPVESRLQLLSFSQIFLLVLCLCFLFVLFICNLSLS